MIRINPLKIISVLYILLLSHTSIAQNGVEFNNMWIAESPPGSNVMAAYLDIVNKSDNTVIIEPPSSPDFKKLEFHQTLHENGLARMKQQPSLTIGEHDSISLSPGGYHLMLFNPVKRFSAGDKITFSFRINREKEVTVEAQVKKHSFMKAGPSNNHSHH